jgi:adenine-specific DNA-methyltransferase
MGKAYENTTEVADFEEAHRVLLPEIVRVVREGGSICWQTGYHVKRGAVVPLDFVVHSILSEHRALTLRNRIIWTFGHGQHATARLSGRHETLLWYTKGKEYFFDLDSIRVPQKYPGKKHYKGKRKGEYSGNPNGKNPSDVWEIPNVKAAHVEKTVHPCQFPVGLASRVVRSMCPIGGVVLDPFCGVASTGVAALLHGRTFLGAEIESKYVRVANKRLRLAVAKKAKIRPVDLDVLDPAQAGAVAKRPDHFRARAEVV